MSIPILSFFTGAGFLDIGFKQAGFETIWHNEYDFSFVKGFQVGMQTLFGKEIPSKQINTQSITELLPKQIAKEAFGQMPKPELFGIIGGPPCPDFSIGGKNRGSTGKNGILSQVYIEKIIDLAPTFFLFENVPGLLRTAKHREFLTELVKQLSTNYILDINVLNSLDYGVPQDRERIFIVGLKKEWAKKNMAVEFERTPTRKKKHLTDAYNPEFSEKISELGLLNDPWFPWEKRRVYVNAKEKYNWPDTNPFGSNPQKPDLIPNELMVGPLICNEEEVSLLPNGLEGFVPYSKRFMEVYEGDDSKKSFKRLHRWRYSPAAAYGNNEVHLHPNKPRRITVREALRIQTVPDEYCLPPEMPLSHKFKTIGNGVPVKLAKAVATSFSSLFNNAI